jgi:hypothetical protein
MAADLLSQRLSVELARFIRENALVLDCNEHGLVCEYLALDTKQLHCAECLGSLDEEIQIRNIIIVQTDEEQVQDQPLLVELQADKSEPKLEEDKRPEGRAKDAESAIDEIQEVTDGWNCTHCTLLNPLARSICSACYNRRVDEYAEEAVQPRRESPELAKRPRPNLRAAGRYDELEDDKQPKALHEEQGSQRSDDAEVLHSDQFYSSKEIEESECVEWQCSGCTLLNKLDQYFCTACDSIFTSLERHLSPPDRPYRSSAYQSRSPPKPKPICESCLKEASYETDKCLDCRLADIRGADKRGSLGKLEMWECAGCTRLNSSFSSVCYHCDEHRDAVNLPERNRRRLYLEVCKRCYTPNKDDVAMCAKCFDSLRVSSLDDYQPREFVETCVFCRFPNTKDSPTCEGCHRSLRASASQLRRTYYP